MNLAERYPALGYFALIDRNAVIRRMRQL